LTWAQWLMDSGKPGQAEEVLKKAISMAPEESGAYAMLGEMYANREDYAKAMKVWSQWLNLRIDTFSQVGFINKIARTLLDKNQHQVAYDLASISAQSGQAEAGLLKAEAAEGLGMYEEAEKLINDVIRRYPYGRVSVYLALFHLRQGDFESAATTLRKNKDRGEFMFYKHDVVDIFAKNNQAGSAFNFVSRVEDREDGVRMSWMFGEALMKKGFHKEAADVFRPWISKSAYDNAQPYTFAMLYFKAMREGGLATDQQILDEIWGLIQDDPKVREFFGLILVMNGMYDQGYMALKRLMVENPAQRDLRLFIIAYAWLGGSQDPRQAKWILEAAANVEQPWTADLVMYVLGEMDENEIRRLADDRDKAADLHYALGLMSRKKGDVQTATKHFLICLDTMSEKNLGYMFGRFELKRMHEKKENI